MSENPIPELDILWHPGPDKSDLQYIRRLAGNLAQSGICVRHLTLRRLLSTQNPVVHIHWPEHLVRSNGSRAKRWLKQLNAVAIAGALWLRRDVRLVWTAHNLAPHVGSRNLVERLVFEVVMSRVSQIVVLVPGHEDPLRAAYPRLTGKTMTFIPSGAVTDVTPSTRSTRTGPVRLFVPGLIGHYKQQLEAVRGLLPLVEEEVVEVTVSGPEGDEDVVAALVDLAKETPGLEVSPGWQDDEVFDRLLMQSDAVVALQRNPFNSGVPYFSLPAGVPIILNPSRQTEFLQSTLPEGSVIAINDPTSSMEWHDIVETLKTGVSGGVSWPHDWANIAEATAALYDAARSPAPSAPR